MTNIFEQIQDLILNLFNYLPNHNIYGYNSNIIILLFSTLFLTSIFRSNLNYYKFPYFFILLEFPGTVLHEFSHAIVGLLFGNKIIKINLIPKIIKNNNSISIKYGYVSSEQKYKGSSVLSSISPFFIIPFLTIYLFNITNNLEYHYIYQFFILLFIFPSAILSKQDLKVFFKDLFSIIGFLIFSIFISILYYYHIEIFNLIYNFTSEYKNIFIYYDFIILLLIILK